MKKVCFVVSHLGSGSTDLLEILNASPNCMIQNSPVTYSNPTDLNWLFSVPHKCRDRSAIYGDHLLFNASLSCKGLYERCRFIYVIRPARASLNQISMMRNKTGIHGKFAARYYTFRLRRICEMARKTQNSLFLTWDDLSSGRAFSAIEEYLGLKTHLVANNKHFKDDIKDCFDERMVSECEDAYERYYYYLDKLGMKRAT